MIEDFVKRDFSHFVQVFVHDTPHTEKLMTFKLSKMNANKDSLCKHDTEGARFHVPDYDNEQNGSENCTNRGEFLGLFYEEGASNFAIKHTLGQGV